MSEKLPSWITSLVQKDESELVLPLPSISVETDSNTDYYLNYAKLETESALNNLKIINPQDKESVSEEYLRLSENFLIQGNFPMALEYAKTPEQKKRVEQIKAAYELPDDTFCDCKDTVSENSKSGIGYDRFITLIHIYSEKDKQVIPVKQCIKCGFTNMTTEKTETQKQIDRALPKAVSDKDVF